MANVKDLIVNGDARIVGKLYANQSMPDGVFFLSNVSGTAAVTSSPYTSAKWYTTTNDNRITSLYSGLTIALKIPVTGHWTYGTLLNVNGLGDHPVVVNLNTMVGERYSVGSTILLTYNATQTATAYNNNASASTYTGCWQFSEYDSTIVYQLKDNNANIPIWGTNLYRYQLCFTNTLTGGLIPYNEVNNATTNYTKTLNDTPFDPYGPIYFYSSTTTVNAGSNVAAGALFQHINFDCRYSMNIQSDGTSGTTALTPYKPVYVKVAYDGYGLCHFVNNTSSTNYLERSCIVQELPDSNPADRSYDYAFIYLGRASSKYQIELDVHHPVYYWNSQYEMMSPFIPLSSRSIASSRATQDGNWNNIVDTYATKTELNTAIGNINSALDAINGEVI